MKILGISTGHDSGAAIIEEGKIICAVNEERLNRIKNYWGPCPLSVKKCLELSGVRPQDINLVAYANITRGGGVMRDFSSATFKKKTVDFVSYLRILDTSFVRWLYLKIFKPLRPEKQVIKFLRELGVTAPIKYVEHHAAHAASAYYTSSLTSLDKALVLTVDGSGDGLCCTLSLVDGLGRLLRKHDTSFYHSPGVIYSYVTHNLGFKYLSHEGKITGLAAFGNPDKTLPVFRKVMTVNKSRLQFRTHLGCWGRPAARKLHALLQGYKREDIAAGVQARLEEVCVELVTSAARKYRFEKLALAGGVFANVKLNQKLLELDFIKQIFIHPHMGDGGEAVGSALAVWADFQRQSGKVAEPNRLQHVYLGPRFADQEIKQALDEAGLVYSHPENVEHKIAEFLAAGKIVARFNGAMEYGPRALGNRSILYPASDKAVNEWLNKQLRRTEFMPFAPILLEKNAGYFLENYKQDASVPAEFMTITYGVTTRCKQEAPAIVHVDGTARPQIVYRHINPSVASILEEYEKLTGKCVLVNTSFNMHEEPIVCTPSDAIRAYQLGDLDVLAIGNYIVETSRFKK